MSDKTITMERADTAEAMAAAFAQPAGELVPMGHHPAPMPHGQGVTVHDGIITAQKVAVERDLGKVMRNIKILAATAGDDWYYRFPVKKKGGGVDHIEGPSIKCANNVARLYGNCQIDTRVLDNGDSWIIYARFVDYETGFSMTRPFQQRKGQTGVKSSDAGRQLDIALQIGVSKAIRNVVNNALETFVTFAFEEARNNLVEKVGKRLPEYRIRIIERLGQMGIDIKRVEAALGRGHGDWLAGDVARVIAEIKAIADGMATPDETWPSDTPAEPQRKDFQKQAGDGAPPASGAAATSAADKLQGESSTSLAEPKVSASDVNAAQAKTADVAQKANVVEVEQPATNVTAASQEPGWPLYSEHGDEIGEYDPEPWIKAFDKARPKAKPAQKQFDENNLDTAKKIATSAEAGEDVKKQLGDRFGPALW